MQFEFQNDQHREAYQREVKLPKFLKQPLEFSSAHVVMIQDQPRNEFPFRVKSGQKVRIAIGKDSRQWKVDR